MTPEILKANQKNVCTLLDYYELSVENLEETYVLKPQL